MENNQFKQPTNDQDKKKKRKILLGVLIPVGVIGLTAGIVAPCVMCSKKKDSSQEEVKVVITGNADYDKAKSYVAKDKQSTIVISPKEGEEITEIKSVKVGDKEITDFTYDKTTKTITIPASSMKSTNVEIDVKTETIDPMKQSIRECYSILLKNFDPTQVTYKTSIAGGNCKYKGKTLYKGLIEKDASNKFTAVYEDFDLTDIIGFSMDKLDEYIATAKARSSNVEYTAESGALVITGYDRDGKVVYKLAINNDTSIKQLYDKAEDTDITFEYSKKEVVHRLSVDPNCLLKIQCKRLFYFGEDEHNTLPIVENTSANNYMGMISIRDKNGEICGGEVSGVKYEAGYKKTDYVVAWHAGMDVCNGNCIVKFIENDKANITYNSGYSVKITGPSTDYVNSYKGSEINFTITNESDSTKEIGINFLNKDEPEGTVRTIFDPFEIAPGETVTKTAIRGTTGQLGNVIFSNTVFYITGDEYIKHFVEKFDEFNNNFKANKLEYSGDNVAINIELPSLNEQLTFDVGRVCYDKDGETGNNSFAKAQFLSDGNFYEEPIANSEDFQNWFELLSVNNECYTFNNNQIIYKDPNNTMINSLIFNKNGYLEEVGFGVDSLYGEMTKKYTYTGQPVDTTDPTKSKYAEFKNKYDAFENTFNDATTKYTETKITLKKNGVTKAVNSISYSDKEGEEWPRDCTLYHEDGQMRIAGKWLVDFEGVNSIWNNSKFFTIANDKITYYNPQQYEEGSLVKLIINKNGYLEYFETLSSESNDIYEITYNGEPQ